MKINTLLLILLFLPTLSFSKDRKKDNCDVLCRLTTYDKLMKCIGAGSDTVYEYRFNSGGVLSNAPIIISTITMNKRDLLELADSLKILKNIPFKRRNKRTMKLSFGMTIVNLRRVVGFYKNIGEAGYFYNSQIDHFINVIYEEATH